MDAIQPIEEKIVWSQQQDILLKETNCYGTALYLGGVLPVDIVIRTGKGLVREIIQLLDTCENPREKTICFSSMPQGIIHASFIYSIDPFIWYHRDGFCGKFWDFSSMEELEVDYLRPLNKNHIWIHNPQWVHTYYHLPTSQEKLTKIAQWRKKIIDSYTPSG